VAHISDSVRQSHLDDGVRDTHECGTRIDDEFVTHMNDKYDGVRDSYVDDRVRGTH